MKTSLTNRVTNSRKDVSRIIGIACLALLLCAAPLLTATAETASELGSARSFAALSGTALTCTEATATGDMGSWPGNAISRTNCTASGAVHGGDEVAKEAYSDFLGAYNALMVKPCTQTILGNLGGLTLNQPGVYCVDTASTTTNGVLTLDGPANGLWVFKIGTSGLGALTGTNFSVVMTGGGLPCNVYWRVADAATITDSAFQGSILAGTAITITGGTLNGNTLAQGAITITGTTITGCEQTLQQLLSSDIQGADVVVEKGKQDNEKSEPLNSSSK